MEVHPYQQKKGMINMKKRFSMLLALAMLVTSLVPSFTANAAFKDVADNNPYREAIVTLSTLDVINGYDDGTFAPDKNISRAEFTKMIVYMLGLGTLSTPITTFPDVSADHWANANIRTAFDLGIINGFDDGTFRPDDPVTYEQALKMVVCTLGYMPFAEAMGGYPNGYRSQASNLKLTDKVTGVGFEAPAPRGIIAQVMFNALEVPKYENINGDWKDSGMTLLKDYQLFTGSKCVLLGVGDSVTSELKTLINSSQMNPLYPTQMAVKDSTSNNIHVINFAKYDITSTQLIDLLGSTIQVYFRQDNLSTDKWLVEISNEIHKTEELSLHSSEIIDLSGNTLRYREEGASNSQSASLNMSNISIRYNGQAVSSGDMINFGTVSNPDNEAFPAALSRLFDSASSDFMYGTVKLVSTEAADTYSMLDIYNYKTLVSQRTVSSSDYKVVDRRQPTHTLLLNPDSDSYTFVLTRDGKDIEPTQIVANNVVLYAESLDGSYKNVRVSSKNISGKISSVNTAKKIITINNNDYAYSQEFENSVISAGNPLTPGLTVKAYIDDFGTVQYGTVQASDSFMPYAYVIAGDLSNDEVLQLKLFAPSNTSAQNISSSTTYAVKAYTVADNAKLNGVRTPASAIDTALQNSTYIPDSSDGATNTNAYNQFIRVSFNAAGEIDNIATETADDGKNIDTSKLERYPSSYQAYTVTSSAVKNGTSTMYSIRSSTPLFVIPSNRNDTTKYALKPAISSTSMISGGTYKVDAYDISESNYPTVMAVYNPTSNIQSGKPISVDTKYALINNVIRTDYDSEYGEVSVVEAFEQSTSTTEKKFSIAPINSKDFSLIGKGDIVLIGYNGDSFANDYEIVLDYDDVSAKLATGDWTDDSKFAKPAKTGSSKSTRVNMYNVVRASYEENILHVSREAVANQAALEANYDEIAVSSSTPIVRYDAEADEFTPFAPDSSSNLTIENIYDYANNGTECSRIAVVSLYTSASRTVQLIVIY